MPQPAREPLMLRARATLEECARARMIAEARQRGVERPHLLAVTRGEAQDVDDLGHAVFEWRALLRPTTDPADTKCRS